VHLLIACWINPFTYYAGIDVERLIMSMYILIINLINQTFCDISVIYSNFDWMIEHVLMCNICTKLVRKNI